MQKNLLALLLMILTPSVGLGLPLGFNDTVFGFSFGLDATAMAFAPDGRLFVLQQSGAVRIISGGLQPTPFMTLTVDSTFERGLLGIAFDPDFASNRYLYLYYTATTPAVHNRVSRFTASLADPNLVEPGSELVLMDLENLTAGNHNGGALHFGIDGKLYIGVGENAVPANAQTLSNRLGKILRINSDGSIPADNPFVATSGANPAIWAYGFRNPFTFAVQPGTGRIYVNDVGEGSYEEINELVRGGFFGWPLQEGLNVPPGLIYQAPVYSYPHNGGLVTGCAITGGAFYNPPVSQFPASYTGQYFFGDLCGGWVRSLTTANAPVDFITGYISPVGYEVGPDGALYVLARGSAAVFRIVYAAPRISQQPANQVVTQGQVFTFQTAATGEPAPSYQWLRNGLTISGANSPIYSAMAMVGDNGAQYVCQVSNAYGTVLSNAGVLTVTNQPTSSTILVSSTNPSVFGHSVTLTATVTPTPATGTITFLDGATVLGIRNLSGGQATFTTTLLASGARSLKAFYSGNSSYGPSTSPVLTQTVNQTPGQGGFATRVDYAVGNAFNLAVGDFNGDGRADVAVTRFGSPNGIVSVLLNTGNGVFQAAVDYNVGFTPTSVVVADFNGDGRSDLAVTSSSNHNVGVLLGNGNGAFQTTVSYSAGNFPQSVAAGDFNGDGLADLAVASYVGVSVLLSHGDGTFQTALNYEEGVRSEFLAVGDFNEDGKSDLVVSNTFSDSVKVMLGTGGGTFQPAVHYGLGNSPGNSYPVTIAIGDFNGDGHSDLAVANFGANNLSVLLGNGHGVFQAAMNYAAQYSAGTVAVGDFNGDGRSDLAVTDASGSLVSIRLGNSDGTFQPPVNYVSSGQAGMVVVADFNGDGWSDVAVTTPNLGALAVLMGSGLALAGPTAVSVSPASGSSTSQAFIFQFSNNWEDLGVVNILVNKYLDGGHACYIAYSRPLNMLYLVNDAGNGLLPGLVLNASGSTSNSQCTIQSAGSSAYGLGNTLNLTLNMSFTPAFSGDRIFYLAARDPVGSSSGWQALGAWRIPGGAPVNPSVTAVSPGHVSGASQALTFAFTDTAGATDLGIVNVLIHPFLDGGNSCYLAYSRPQNVLYLVADNGSLLPGLALNGSGSVSNSQCTVSGAGSSAVINGNTLTLILNLTMKPAYSGNKIIWAAARTLLDATPGWQTVGTWSSP